MLWITWVVLIIGGYLLGSIPAGYVLVKLKKGIVAHLKRLGFSRDVFEKFTPDEKINESLVEICDKMK